MPKFCGNCGSKIGLGPPGCSHCVPEQAGKPSAPSLSGAPQVRSQGSSLRVLQIALANIATTYPDGTGRMLLWRQHIRLMALRWCRRPLWALSFLSLQPPHPWAARTKDKPTGVQLLQDSCLSAADVVSPQSWRCPCAEDGFRGILFRHGLRAPICNLSLASVTQEPSLRGCQTRSRLQRNGFDASNATAGKRWLPSACTRALCRDGFARASAGHDLGRDTYCRHRPTSPQVL